MTDMNNSNTVMNDSNIATKLRIVNGSPVLNAEASGLMSASAAIRALGIKQHGLVKKQLGKYNIPIVGLGGANGGVYLVREVDVQKAKAKIEAMNRAIKQVEKVEPRVDRLPGSLHDELTELRLRMNRVESKLDKLLAAWGVEAA